MPKKIAEQGFIFDLGGVIVSGRAGRGRINRTLIRQIMRLADQGKPVAFVGSRSIPFLDKKIVSVLREYAKEYPNALKNITIAGEYGLVVATNLHRQRPTVSVANEAVLKEVKIALDREWEKIPNTYTETTMRGHAARYLQKDFAAHANKKEIEKTLKAMEAAAKRVAKRYGGLRIMRAGRSINVVPAVVTKGYGATRALEVQQTEARKYVVVGDRATELELATPLKRKRKPYVFFYTGDPTKLKQRHFATPRGRIKTRVAMPLQQEARGVTCVLQKDYLQRLFRHM